MRASAINHWHTIFSFIDWYKEAHNTSCNRPASASTPGTRPLAPSTMGLSVLGPLLGLASAALLRFASVYRAFDSLVVVRGSEQHRHSPPHPDPKNTAESRRTTP
ncbi:hypothetical protein [Streptomyces sp. NBC_00299]|uniref:hypothetical protein n=1 Tax=Streptomyces sp. NBC_00299 TaxID=2975705 RepID=UPI003FA71D42